MSAPTHTPAKMFLYKVKEYMMDPSTRQHAFQRVSEEFHVSINALRMAAMREGLSECDQSLKYAFPKEYEEALVAACIMYARQGTPLTKHDFAELATRFAKRDGDHIFRTILWMILWNVTRLIFASAPAISCHLLVALTLL